MSKDFNDLIRQFNGQLNSMTNSFAPFFTAFEDTTAKSSVPVDKYFDEEKNEWVIEMAVVGKTKDDVKITSYNKEGKTHLKIEAGQKPTEDESKNRQYIGQRKIKQGYLMVDYTVPTTMDLTKLTAKVANGLLTVVIPEKEKVSEEVTFTIE